MNWRHVSLAFLFFAGAAFQKGLMLLNTWADIQKVAPHTTLTSSSGITLQQLASDNLADGLFSLFSCAVFMAAFFITGALHDRRA